MSARHVAGAVVLSLIGLPLGADNAKARGGSSGSSSSGQRHHGGGGGSSSSSSGSSSSGSSYRDNSSGGGGGGYSRSPQSDAQRRHPRPGTGHGAFRSRGYYSPYYYRPYYYGYYGYYPSWYSGYYGYYGSYDYPYYSGGYRAPYYSGRYRSGDVGSLRLLVDPSEARVYVDGYYAGSVDDFDGLFQRLNLTRGRHELAFKLEGYRTYRMRVYVPADQTLKIHYDMVRGTGEDVREEALGEPEDDRNDDRWSRRDRDEDEADEDDRGRAPVREPRHDSEADAGRAPMRERQPESEEAAPRPSGGRGMLLLQVEPADASIYVDGEFRGAARQARSLELTEGRHRIEVVRPGYKPVEREIEIRAGRSEKLEVSLGQP